MRRPPVPAWSKRLLVPIWNCGHQAAWRLEEYAGAFWHRSLEHCDVCGRLGPMLYRQRVVPPRLVELWGLSPREAEALRRKESNDCWSCGAKLRCRRLARALLDLLGGETPMRSLRDWSRGDQARALQIAEINRIDGIHETLSSLPGWVASEYVEGASLGSVRDGVRCEDLQGLSYEDGRFDLVLSSETLEHVPDLDRALRELHRVLRPGGAHVFTAPVRPGLAQGFARTMMQADGSIEHLAPLLCHPGGDVGYPVFHEFGRDFPERLTAAGFDVEVRFGPVSEDDLAQVYVMRKPGGASER
jgi:SAM-dependent methyltransferase